MIVLSLRILGGFEARRSSGGFAEIPIRKGQALLAFLALDAGEAVARSKLAGLLWGDRGDKQAKASLRQTLTVLRKALRPVQDQVLRADRQSVGLDGAAVDVDAVAFQELVASGTRADLDTAVSLYRGDLLEGLDLSAPEFQAWLEDERRRFHDLMVEALNALMAHRRADGALRDAVVLGQRLLTLEPLREDVHRALMGLYAELGQRHAAQKQYERCRELLRSELNVAPEAETDSLYRALLDNDEAEADTAKASEAAVVRRPTVARAPVDDRSARPPPETAGESRGERRRDGAVGRALATAGIAALVWLMPWAPSRDPPPPDPVVLQRAEVPSLAAPSFASLSGVPEGVAVSAGSSALARVAFPLADGPSPAMPAFDDLAGVLDGVTEYAAFVPEETERRDRERRRTDAARAARQAEADRLWPGLSESWDLRAVRAFRTGYPETSQVAEAERRIAFLIRRQREAQAELNRLGYDAGPTDGIWGLKSARAMRAFQSDKGLAPDGAVSAALLRRLKTAAPPSAAPAAPTPAIPMPQLQPGRARPEVAAVPPSARDGLPEVSRWTAHGSSRGYRIFATATRRGDALSLVFEIEHTHKLPVGYDDTYTQRCTLSEAASECWIRGRPNQTLGAKVSGTFPRLQFSFVKARIERRGYSAPRGVVLDFLPELQVAEE